MGTLRIGLLGCGRIGRLHGGLLRHRAPGLELAVVHDPVLDAASRLAAELGVPAVATVDEVFEHEVDAVAICTPTETHADLVVAAADAGVGVFCEKPISLDLATVDHALAAVDAAGVVLQIGFNRRFDPSHRAVRDAVASGEVGRPELVRITSRDPQPPPADYLGTSGGILLDMTVHDFDMARFVVGDEVEEVTAAGAVLVDDAIGAIGDHDTVVVLLRYRSGALGVIDNSRRAAYGYDQRVEVHGSAGMVRSDNVRPHATVLETATGASRPPVERFFLERYTPSYLAGWAAFEAALRAGGPSEVPGADGRAPLVLGLAAMRSLEERRPVDVAEITR